MNTSTFQLQQGTLPLLISIPHLGTDLPAEFASHMSASAGLLQDTDWHLDRLYGFAHGLGASVIQAKVSRYVIDLNRPPSGESLYPGQTTTGLCPVDTFHGEALYGPEDAPDASEQARRLALYWRPYHAALRAEIDRLKAHHGAVLLWDAHSIASELPRLFEGRLPDLNFGTADGRSCAPAIIDAVLQEAEQGPFSWVHNGRFKGGHITRHYGSPTDKVHTIQLEMGQHLYMNEAAPFAYLEHKATAVQPLLQKMLLAALAALK